MFNAGPDPALNAQFTDTLDGNLTFVNSHLFCRRMVVTTPAVGSGGTISCSNPNLAAGASGAFTLTTNVPAGTPSGTFDQNFANASSAISDPTPENNQATAGTLVLAAGPDLTIAKTHSGTPVQGQTGFVYTITVSNPGTGGASGTTTVQDTLPPGLPPPRSAARAGPARLRH